MTMDPTRCCVIVVDCYLEETTSQKPQPYFLDNSVGPADDSQRIQNNEFIELLHSNFVEVSVVSNGTTAIKNLRSRPRCGNYPTIVLIDIDHKPSEFYHRSREHFQPINFDDMDEASIETLSVTAEETDPLYGLDLLKVIAKDIEKGTIHEVVPIVYSKSESSKLMIHCMNLGAADYILKPITRQVIKTLFLNIYRQNPFRNKFHIPEKAVYSEEMGLLSQPDMNCLQDRLVDVFVKEKWITELLVDYYSPHNLSINLSTLDASSSQENIISLQARLSSWDFIPHELSAEDQLRCVCLIFEHVLQMDGLSHIVAPKELLHRFILAIRNSYHNTNPYHNFAHALDVLQSMYYFLCKMGVLTPMHPNSSAKYTRPQNSARFAGGFRMQDLLRPTDVFALIVASIGHDVGHPGVNNGFLVNSGTPLALLYNDRSVLESFHSMALFQLMKKYGFDCFKDDSPLNPDYMEFRKLVVDAILATDMGLHFDYVHKIKEQYTRLKTTKLDMSEPRTVDRERTLLLGALIKCADISNCSRPFNEAERWSGILLEEFVNQGDLEKYMGIPVLPTGDREKISLEDSQIGFIGNVAMPLFEAVRDIIPEMGYTVDQMSKNIDIWKERKAAGPPPTRDSHRPSDTPSQLSQQSTLVSPIPAYETPTETPKSPPKCFPITSTSQPAKAPTTFTSKPPTPMAMAQHIHYRVITRGPYDRRTPPAVSRQCSPSLPGGGGPMRVTHGVRSAAAFNKHRRRSSMPAVGSHGIFKGLEIQPLPLLLEIWKSSQATSMENDIFRHVSDTKGDCDYGPILRRSSTPSIFLATPSSTFSTKSIETGS